PFAAPASTSAGFSKAKRRATCRSNSGPNSSWSSTSPLQRRLPSKFRCSCSQHRRGDRVILASHCCTCSRPVLADFVAKLCEDQARRNKRIKAGGFLNQRCVFGLLLELKLRAQRLKIVLQQYRH